MQIRMKNSKRRIMLKQSLFIGNWDKITKVEIATNNVHRYGKCYLLFLIT